MSGLLYLHGKINVILPALVAQQCGLLYETYYDRPWETLPVELGDDFYKKQITCPVHSMWGK